VRISYRFASTLERQNRHSGAHLVESSSFKEGTMGTHPNSGMEELLDDGNGIFPMKKNTKARRSLLTRQQKKISAHRGTR